MSPGSWTEIAGAWVAFLLTLFIFSSLWRENALSRLAEHLLVGTAAGYAGVVIIRQVLVPRVVQPLLNDPAGNWHLLLPLALAFLWVVPINGKGRGHWAGTLGLALLLGIGAGLVAGGAWLGTLWPQGLAAARLAPGFGSIVLLVLTLSVPVYLYVRSTRFRRQGSEDRRGIQVLSDGVVRLWGFLGQATLFIGLGVIFGRAGTARLALLIARLQALIAVVEDSSTTDLLQSIWRSIAGGA